MLKLGDVRWEKFHLSDIFKEIPRGKISDLRNLENGDTIIIAAAGVQEGFSCFSSDNPCSHNAMTISLNGVGTGTAFVHNYPFNLNSDCGLVVPIEDLSVNVLRFIAVAINKHKNKFNFGYKANENRLLRQAILLPIDENGNMNYSFMDAYIVQEERLRKNKFIKYCHKQLSILGKPIVIDEITNRKWHEFFITEFLQPPKRGKRLTSENYIDGKTPVVSSAGGNNGVIAFAGNKEKVRIYKDCLSVANGGVSAGFAFYHPYSFIATDHVTHFKGAKLNKYHYLFLVTIIRNQLHDKYDFSREMTDPRLKREKLLLPVTNNGEPDYDYMEQYIKNLLIKKYQSYLAFVEQ